MRLGLEKKTKADKSELLKHEQGHFDIAKLFEIELKGKLNNSVYSKLNYQIEIDSIYNELLEKYLALEKKYDEETNHLYNKQEQKKWDLYFNEHIRN